MNRFWLSVAKWLSPMSGYNVNSFSETDIVFGFWNTSKENKVINHIILIGKQLLSESRANNSLPTIHLFIARLKYTCKIEEQIARTKYKPLTHYNKWERLLSITENCVYLRTTLLLLFSFVRTSTFILLFLCVGICM